MESKFTEEQIDYMVNRSINLILSEFEIIGATSNITYSSLSTEEKIKTVFSIMFLRHFFHLTRELLNEIIPKVTRRLVSSSNRVEKEYQDIMRGRVNWQKTILAQIKNENTIITREPRREFHNAENIVLTLTLLEVSKHSSDLLNFFGHFNALVEVEKLKKINQISLHYLRSAYIKECLESANKLFVLEKEYLQRKLEGKKPTRNTKYQQFNDNVEKIILNKKIVNRSYQRIIEWRKNYADLINGFSSLSEKEMFQREWGEDRLFEIWVLCEILAAVKRKKINISAEGGLFEPRTRPLFFIRDNPVYYNTSIEIQESDQEIGGFERRIIRGGRPDMIIINNENRSQSFIIDMKNYNQTSTEAYYKILGYTANYNVNNGVVVYPVPLESNQLVNVTQLGKNIIISIDENRRILSMTLKPGEKFEDEIVETTDQFADFIIKTLP